MIRRSLGRWFISLGIRIYGDTKDEKVITSEMKEKLDMPPDAAVEANKVPEQWAPEQHGNVIIAEPILMVKDRRGEL